VPDTIISESKVFDRDAEVYTMETIDNLKHKYQTMRPYLNEMQWRLYLATEAHASGRGGVTIVSNASGATLATIHIGLKELTHPPGVEQRHVRRPGGGRKKLRDKNPELVEEFNRLVDPETRGDPM